MNMNQFRKHLQEVEGKLVHPQASAMYEDKKQSGKSLEDTISSLSNTSSANVDIPTEINENMMNEYGGGGKKKMGEYGNNKKKMGEYGNKKKMYEDEDIVKEYLEGFFGGELTEDNTDDDIMEAVEDIVLLSCNNI